MRKRRGFSVQPVFMTVPEGCAPARVFEPALGVTLRSYGS